MPKKKKEEEEIVMNREPQLVIADVPTLFFPELPARIEVDSNFDFDLVAGYNVSVGRLFVDGKELLIIDIISRK